MIGALAGGLSLRGETPFGTCFLQATADVLDRRGVEESVHRLGPSWGFRWHSLPRLSGGDRWISATSALTGIALDTYHPATWRESRELEKELLDAGHDLVTAVDSYDIPSGYHQVEHITHAVVVREIADDHAVVIDVMNHPQPRRMDIADYARSRMSDVAHGFAIGCGGPATAAASPGEVASLVEDEVARHRDELAVLHEYVGFVSESDGRIDVADVAGERLAFGQLLAGFVDTHDWAEEGARIVGALARRWYLVHTMAREMTNSGTTGNSGRLSRLLEQLHQRESDANRWFTDRLTAGVARVPRMVPS